MSLVDISNHTNQQRAHLKAQRPRSSLVAPSVLARPFDNYTLGRRLGSGTFGQVFEATDKHKKKLALKIVRIEELSSPEETFEAVHCELETWKLSQGQRNVLSLFAAKKLGPMIYFAMDSCVSDVRKLVMHNAINSQTEAIPEELARNIIYQALAGLVHMHRFGVVHRDLKPENMLLTAEGVVQITDFGWGRRLEHGKKTKTRGGSAEFLAPEIFEKVGYTHSVDNWALGVCLYEFLVGTNYLLECMDKETQETYNAKTEFLKANQDLLHRMPVSTAIRRSGISDEAQSAVRHLLDRPSVRLGYRGRDYEAAWKSVADHPFFRKMTSRAVIPKQMIDNVLRRRSIKPDEYTTRGYQRLDSWAKSTVSADTEKLFRGFDWSADSTTTNKKAIEEKVYTVPSQKAPSSILTTTTTDKNGIVTRKTVIVRTVFSDDSDRSMESSRNDESIVYETTMEESDTSETNTEGNDSSESVVYETTVRESDSSQTTEDYDSAQEEESMVEEQMIATPTVTRRVQPERAVKRRSDYDGADPSRKLASVINPTLPAYKRRRTEVEK